jgi:hypothetical protein
MHSPPLSTTSPTPPDLETVFEALNLFIAKERQALCAEIEKLTEENKGLVKGTCYPFHIAITCSWEVKRRKERKSQRIVTKQGETDRNEKKRNNSF